MNKRKTVFAQLMEFLPRYEFDKCVTRYNGDYKVQTFDCRQQFLVMSFAQLTSRKSLRDIENCLEAVSNKLYHSGIRKKVPHSTLADANEQRDWRIYADFAQVLILMDLRGSIPTFIKLTDGLCHDVNVLDTLPLEIGAFFVTRAKTNLSFKGYPAPLRRVKFWDTENKRHFVFLTNAFNISALIVAMLYKERWQVELFRWIKQLLRIKSFYGTIRNTAHTSIRGHRTAGVKLRGNTFYSGNQPAISHSPPYDAMIYTNKDTTVTWKNPGWPKEWGYGDKVTAFTMSGNTFLK